MSQTHSSLLLCIFLALPLPSLAAVQTYVASTGSDANTASDCARNTPCRNFTAALGVTDAGGEIIVLDSAAYNPVSIGKSVSIIAPPGVYAGITAGSGAGIEVTATGANVRLRGLTLRGAGGTYGIYMPVTGTLLVENSVISGFSSAGLLTGGPGASVSARVLNSRFYSNDWGVRFAQGTTGMIADSEFHRNTTGGLSVEASGAGASISASIERSSFVSNNRGIYASLASSATARVDVSEVVISQSDYHAVSAFANAAILKMTLYRSSVSGNAATGLFADASSSGGLVRVDVKDSTFNDNATTGVLAQAFSGAAVRFSAHRGQANGNAGSEGYSVYASGAASVADMHVHQSVANDNFWAGAFAGDDGSGATVRASVNGSLMANNVDTGVWASGAGTRLFASGNTVSRNSIGLRQHASSFFYSDGTNTVRNNTSNTSGSIFNVLTM